MPDRLNALLRLFRRRKQLASEMDDEMRFHIQQYRDDLVRNGVPLAEAERRARREFGNLERMKEDCRDAGGFSLFDEFARNTIYAVRQLRRSPGFTIAAIATLGLCIGANTAVFSVIDAALLRPVPYPEPDRLFSIIREIRGAPQDGQDGYAWEALKPARSFDLAAIGAISGVNLSSRAGASYVQQQRVSAAYFRVLGVPLALGREFDANEDRPGGQPSVILSYGIWQRVFHGDPSLVGSTVLLRGTACVVTGVTGKEFRPREVADIWTPLMPSTSGEGAGMNYGLIARLRPGVTRPQANAEAQALGAPLFASRKDYAGVAARMGLAPFDRDLQSAWRTRLLLLSAAVAIVLLIGCVNIASLKLAQGAARRREMGTRIAVGGGPASLLRHLITESFVLGIAGCAAGLALGYGAIAALREVVLRYGIWQELRLDTRVLLATLVLSIVVSILFGLAPAAQAMRVDIRDALLEGGSFGFAGTRSHWLRRGLVLTEVSLSLVLLIGAGLLLRTLLYLQHLDPGFDGTGVVTVSASLQDARYADSEAVNRLYRETLDAIRRTPGVEAAGVGLHVPYQRWLNDGVHVGGETVGTSLNYVTPGYFEALRIPVRAGRVFDERDTSDSMPVAIVNSTFARKFLKGQDPLSALLDGKTHIVGVVGDLQQQPGLNRTGPIVQEPAMYVPASQFSSAAFQMAHTWYSPSWIVRARGGQAAVARAVESAISQFDSQLPIATVHSMTDERNLALQSERVNAWLLGVLAALALLLALIGVYGIAAQTVTERTREFGIRMALGSSAGGLMWDAVAPGMLLAAAGVVMGGALAAGSAGVLKSLLWGVRPLDIRTFLFMAAVLIAVSGAASLFAAFRVTRLTPAAVLRQE
ncbi:MAG TPA: ABC transporter permease [Bryobacteraceae bacterium]|nr:ABC transporter permease [Bryobacteraceae bacterium]